MGTYNLNFDKFRLATRIMFKVMEGRDILKDREPKNGEVYQSMDGAVN